MDELLQQLAAMGLDFDPKDPQFQRVLLANKASQHQLILDGIRQQAQAQSIPFDEKQASEVADEEVFQSSLKQFLTESGQLPALQQSQIARQTGQRLRTEQDPAKRAALQGQLQRLQRISGLNMNQEEPVSVREELGRSALGAAAHLASSPASAEKWLGFIPNPARLAAGLVGQGDEYGQAMSELESEIAGIAPARVTSPVGRFTGELAGTAAPFAAATKLPFAVRGGATLGEMVGGATGAVGSKLFPSATRALAPEIGGGAVREGFKAAARTAIPNAAAGATEFAVLDPAGTEEDPLQVLLMGSLLGQGKTLADARAGSLMGRIGQRVIPESTPLEDLGPAGLQEGQILRFKGNEPTDALRGLSTAELEAQPLGKTPSLENSAATPGSLDAQIASVLGRERRGAGPQGVPSSTGGPYASPQEWVGKTTPGERVAGSAMNTPRERRSGQQPFDEDFILRQPFDRRIPAPQRVSLEEPQAPVEPEFPTLEGRQDVKGYDLASQLDRELGGAREDLARTRIARIQRQLVEAREKRNALLQREASTGLPEPQREELLSMEHHFETLLRDLENARESLRGGSARTGAPFRAIQEARQRVGRAKRRKPPQ